MRSKNFSAGYVGWPSVTLGEIFDIGSSKRVLQKQWKQSGVPFYRAREIVRLAKSGSVENDLFISEQHFNELKGSHGVPNPGDLMVSAVGTLGACYVVRPHDRFYFKDASVLQFQATKEIEPRFFQYLFLSDAFLREVKNGEGATVGTLTISRAKSLSVRLPPLDEQHRIVAVLDQAFAALDRARALAEANLADAEALFQATLQDMFATKAIGEEKTLQGVCSVITDGTHNAPPYVDIGIPMLDTKNIGNDLAIDQTSASKFISKETDALLAKRCKPRIDDVLVSSRGTIGKLAIVSEGQDFNIMGNIILLRPKPNLRPLYLAYRLMAEVVKIQDISRGAAQKGLYLKPMREYPVRLPDLKAQDEIIAQLDKISDGRRQLKASYHGKLLELDDLRQSLLQKAFAGELT